MLARWNKAKRREKHSKEILNQISTEHNPFGALRADYRNFDKLTYEDYILLLRNSPLVFMDSHEFSDIFERTGYNFDAMAVDIARLFRDKHVERERRASS